MAYGTCTASGPPGWVVALALGLLVLLPIVVAVVLYRRAQRRAAVEPGEPVSAPAAAASPLWGPLEVGGVLALGLGGLVFPVVPTLVGYALVCCSPRWSVQEKTVAGVLSLVPLTMAALALVGDWYWPLQALGTSWIILLAGAFPALAAVYLAVTLSRRR